MMLGIDQRHATRHGVPPPRNSLLLGLPRYPAPSLRDLRDADRLPARPSLSKRINTTSPLSTRLSTPPSKRRMLTTITSPPSTRLSTPPSRRTRRMLIHLPRRALDLNPEPSTATSAAPAPTFQSLSLWAYRRSQRAVAIAAVFTISEGGGGGGDASPFITTASNGRWGLRSSSSSAARQHCAHKHSAAVPQRSSSSCGSFKQQQLQRRSFTALVVPSGQTPPSAGHLGRRRRARSSGGRVGSPRTRTLLPKIAVTEAVLLRPMQPAPPLAIRVAVGWPAGRAGCRAAGVSRVSLAERRGRRGLTVQLGLPISTPCSPEDIRPDAPTEAQRDQLFGQATKLLLDRTALNALPSDAEVTAFLAIVTVTADAADGMEMVAASDDEGADTEVIVDPGWAVRELSRFCTLGLK